jgi:CubicO group peptidase (beta-lactamase class C family)
MLVDRGLLKYDVPVTRYWPEFGQNGKGQVTVGQLLSHQAGICGPAQPVALEDYFNHGKIASMLAAQAPFWPLGSGWGYHAIVFGHLADELVRRTDGRTIGRFFADEVARPLEADAFLGLPESEDRRQVAMIKPEGSPPPAVGEINELAAAANANPALDGDWSNRRDWRAAGIAGAGGSTNARGLARIYGALARGGEIDGVRLLSPRTLHEATVERVRGANKTSGLPGAYGAGFALNHVGAMGPNSNNFGHGGWGGSMAFADPKEKLGIAYAMNRMLVPAPGEPNPRVVRLVTATYSSL